jgi:hypothetical protein
MMMMNEFERVLGGMDERSHMSIDEAVAEWSSKKRSMGCVSATDWFVRCVSGFKPVRLNRYTKNGDLFQHVVASNGVVVIDLAPYADLPKDFDPRVDGDLRIDV